MSEAWRTALHLCAQDTHERLAPLWRACMQQPQPGLAQMSLELRNAAAHIHWSLDNHDSTQVAKAHDHVRRAALDGCKLLWQSKSIELGAAEKRTAKGVIDTYAQLTLTAFREAQGSHKDVLDTWLEFLRRNGVYEPAKKTASSPPKPPQFDLPLNEDIERLTTLAIGWGSLRQLDARLTALTLRMSEALLPSHRDLWFAFCSQVLGNATGSPSIHPHMQPGAKGPSSFHDQLRATQSALEEQIEYWHEQLFEIALGDVETFDPAAQNRIYMRAANLRNGAASESEIFEATTQEIESLAPWYPVAKREEINARWPLDPSMSRPTGQPQMAAQHDGLIWFCDLVGSSSFPEKEAESLLEDFLEGAAQALVPAKKAGALIAANTWGDQAMAAFADHHVGMDTLHEFLTGYALKAADALRLRIGLATGLLTRIRNPITRYDVTGVAVIEAARLEPCATPGDSRYEVLCSKTTAARVAHVPGWSHCGVSRTVAKSFILEGQSVASGDVIDLVCLAPVVDA